MPIPSPAPVKETAQDNNNRNFYNELQRLYGEVVDIADTGVGVDTDFSVSHNLNKIPTHVEILVKEGQSNAYLAIRPGSVAWSRSAVSLQCNTANAAIRVRIV